MTVHDSKQAFGLVRRVTLAGMAVNLLLAGVKIALGLLGSSRAVLADGIHSLSDLSTDIAVIVGVRFWSAPPDEDHPYGHNRIETLVTVGIGLFLAAAAVTIGYEALSSFRSGHSVQTRWIAAAGPLLSIVFKEMMYRWTARVGRKIKSPAVTANAWHHRSDSLSSLPALAAVVASAVDPAWAFVDSIGAVVVALFILKVAWDIIHPALTELADRGATHRERETIQALAGSVEGVREVHGLRARRAGSGLFVDLHVLVDSRMTVRKGHEISETVKNTLLDRGPEIVDVVVHIEPCDRVSGVKGCAGKPE
ncbi:MAG TPA: cation transporter [bacterium]|nr:cation transporter [bacterium]